jgi:glycosyltransferase involved in cell wall biosynthesis
VWPQKVCDLLSRADCGSDNLRFYLLKPEYWPLIEKVFPDSCNSANLARAVAWLVRKNSYDWIEIESEEGIEIEVLKSFPRRTILRIHTTLRQMVEYKKVPVTRLKQYCLSREEKSFRLAGNIVTHSRKHCEWLRSEYPFLRSIDIVSHGCDIENPGVEEAVKSGYGRDDVPVFLIVGSADRRKGFDRIRAVLDAYAGQFGKCRFVIVSNCQESVKQAFRLVSPFSSKSEVVWRHGLSNSELINQYQQASALLHLARYESFGLPFIESAAMGLPIVTTDTGVAGEILAGNLKKYLVDGDNPEECAGAMHSAVLEKEKIGALLKEIYRQRFTRNQMVDAYLDATRRNFAEQKMRRDTSEKSSDHRKI